MGKWTLAAGFALAPLAVAQSPSSETKQAKPPVATDTQAVDAQAAPQPGEKPTEHVGSVTPTQPADKPIEAVVGEVSGSVESAPIGTSILAEKGWASVKVNDRLTAGMQIRTGLRSYVNLQFGETSVVSIRSASNASIDVCYRSANTEVVRLGLGYGTVRGGSTEGEVRSDLIVDSPPATLAKIGTEGWQISVEPMTGRFSISLAEYGLVEAVQKLAGDRQRSRRVRPGEYATETNIANMWVKQDIFDRSTTFYEAQSVSLADADFGASNTRGFGAVAPGGGADLAGTSRGLRAEFVLDQIAANSPGGTGRPSLAILQPAVLTRREGSFGTASTFRVLVPTRSLRAMARRPLAKR